MTRGRLYIVPTPIGNLKDITIRAIEVLKESDIIFAEDTRTSGKLLKEYDIATPLESFHQHNEHKKLESVIERLKSGTIASIISDAGTPGISDPGFLLVRECIAENIPCETLPGPTALIPALVNSGFPINQFVFEGFLPIKKGRKSKLENLSNESRTIVLYESPHRLVKTLKQIMEVFDNSRRVSVSREISKKFEETIRGPLTEIISHFSENVPKGEFVIVIENLK